MMHARDLQKLKRNMKAKTIYLEVNIMAIPINVVVVPSKVASQGFPIVSMGQLPGLAEVKFSGKVEEYLEFEWNWLAQYGCLDNDTKIQYLKSALWPDAQ